MAMGPESQVADGGAVGYCFRHSGGIVKNGTESRPGSEPGLMDRPNPSRKDSKGRSGSTVSLWALSGLWMEMLASILGLGLLGYGLDRWIGIFPWLTVIGTVLGVIGGLYNAVKKAMGITNPPNRERNDKRND